MDKLTWRDYVTPGAVFDTILLTILIIGLVFGAAALGA